MKSHRRSPRLHNVRDHQRQDYHVNNYMRGKGSGHGGAYEPAAQRNGAYFNLGGVSSEINWSRRKREAEHAAGERIGVDAQGREGPMEGSDGANKISKYEREREAAENRGEKTAGPTKYYEWYMRSKQGIQIGSVKK